MSVLYVTEPDEDTGMVAVITDEPCPCGWPETVLHIMPDGATTRGCPSCETETQDSREGSTHGACTQRTGAAMSTYECAGGLPCHTVEVDGGWQCIHCHVFIPRPLMSTAGDAS